MARVKTFVNNGSLLPADLNSIQDDYEAAFSQYNPILERGAKSNATTAGTYLLSRDSSTTAPKAVGDNEAALQAFYLDPADYAAGTRAVKIRLLALVLANGTTSTDTYTFGLYPVTGTAGGANQVSVTLGTVVSGSTTAITLAGIGAQINHSSVEFTCPAAGTYALGVVLGSNEPAGSSVALVARLATRQV